MTRLPLPDPVWYAVMTAPRREFDASVSLRRAGYWTWIPFDRVRRAVWNPRQRKHVPDWINVPHFSRYCFFAFRYADEDASKVETADGVSSVVEEKST